MRLTLPLVAAIVALGTTLAGSTLAAEPLDKVPAAANPQGKYEGLLRVISVPEDKAQYGETYDYGEFPACDYADYQDLPQAYWVYVAPKWYLWKGLATDKKLPAAANANGKYQKLLVRLHVPEDEATYGKEYDWGAWNGTSYKSFDKLPPGYWVYAAPHWYIWEQQRGAKPGEFPAPPPAPPKPE